MAEKNPQLLQFLEISLLQRKATALTLLGSGKLLRTEKKCSFISGGQRKNVVCPDIIFVPPKAAGSHFCGSASCSSGSPQLCCQSRELGAPKGRPRLSKNPWKKTGEGTGEMPVLWAERTKDRPSFSCDLSLSLSAHFTSYISFGSCGEEGRGSTEQARGSDKWFRCTSVQPAHPLLWICRLVALGSDEAAGAHKTWDHNTVFKGKQSPPI